MVEGEFLINGLNEACSNIAASYLKIRDESMSAMRFCKNPKENLPQFSYILHEPEPLGVELNMFVLSVK